MFITFNPQEFLSNEYLIFPVKSGNTDLLNDRRWFFFLTQILLILQNWREACSPKISQYTHSPIKFITRTPTHRPWKAVIPQARALPVCMHSCENITHTKLHWGRDNMQLSNVQYLHQSKQNGASGKKGVMQTFRTQHALRGGKWFRGNECMPLTQKFMKWKPNHKCIRFRRILIPNG